MTDRALTRYQEGHFIDVALSVLEKKGIMLKGSKVRPSCKTYRTLQHFTHNYICSQDCQTSGLSTMLSVTVCNIKYFIDQAISLLRLSIAPPLLSLLVATLSPNAPTNIPPFYFSPGQNDCNGAERPKDNHGGSSVHPTRPVGH